MRGCGVNQAGRGEPFRGRPDQYRRFLGPREGLLAIAVTAGEMQDLFAISPDTDGRAQFARLLKIFCEKIDETLRVP